MKKTLFCLTLLSLSGFTFADNCDNARNTYDDIYCTNKVYASADLELSNNYQSRRSKLNTNQKAVLKKSQLGWIRARDAECTTDTGVDVQCRLTTTQQRNNWLRERIRECQTIGCKSTALAD